MGRRRRRTRRECSWCEPRTLRGPRTPALSRLGGSRAGNGGWPSWWPISSAQGGDQSQGSRKPPAKLLSKPALQGRVSPSASAGGVD